MADDLNRADGQLGDGDLGITLTRAARELEQVIGELPEDLGAALMVCARAMTKSGGSSYGTLAATGLMAAAKTVKDRKDVPWTRMGGLLNEAVAAMAARGGATLGDKTVLDAMDAAATAIMDLADPAEQLEAALAATDMTLDRFRDQPNRVGRARILADRSIGLDDPGMLGFREILRGISAP